jgi:hypothetical protein
LAGDGIGGIQVWEKLWKRARTRKTREDNLCRKGFR